MTRKNSMMLATKDIHYLDFDGLDQPVALIGCTNLLELFPQVFHGWHYSLHEAGSDPAITLCRQGDSYVLKAAWLPHPVYRKNCVDIVCAFIAEMSQAYLQYNPHQLCLHAAAAEFSGRLVVFPNEYHTGKSLLSACLAAEGTRIFADDVLPIDMDYELGHAPGFQPRLRLPLPDDLSLDTLKFLHQNLLSANPLPLVLNKGFGFVQFHRTYPGRFYCSLSLRKAKRFLRRFVC